MQELQLKMFFGPEVVVQDQNPKQKKLPRSWQHALTYFLFEQWSTKTQCKRRFISSVILHTIIKYTSLELGI